jgi:carboxypeptidase T
MPLIARASHYHVWDHPGFGPAALGEATLTIPALGAGTESRRFYSLKRDMAELRRRGAAKGIVDAGVISVGNSTQGRELCALKVGLGSAHKVLFTGCHHAREWISVEVPYLVAEYLIETYTNNPSTEKEKRIKHLLHNRQIWFVPMVNPDGHMHTVTVNRNWRANRNSHVMAAGTQARSGAHGGPVSWPAGTYTGVDINRNYATANWGTETFDGADPTTSRNPRDGGADSIWCGVAASGESESQAIDALIRAQAFRASITYHNFSQLLLFPDAAAGHAYVQWVGRGMRDLVNAGGNPYTYQSGSALYETSGDLMDFSFERCPGRPTYTPELRPQETDPAAWFFSGLPEGQILPCFNENLAAALALINCAGHDASAASRTLNLTTAMPAARGQAVRPCWEVFRGWTP